MLLDQAVAALGADAGAVGLVNAAGTEIELRRERRATRGQGLAGWQSFPLDADLPMSVAIRTGEGVWTTSSERARRALPARSRGQGGRGSRRWP